SIRHFSDVTDGLYICGVLLSSFSFYEPILIFNRLSRALRFILSNPVESNPAAIIPDVCRHNVEMRMAGIEMLIDQVGLGSKSHSFHIFMSKLLERFFS